MEEKNKSKCNMSMKYWRLSASYVYCTIYTTVFFCFIYIYNNIYVYRYKHGRLPAKTPRIIVQVENKAM